MIYDPFFNYPKEVIYRDVCNDLCYATMQSYFKLVPLIILFCNYLILSFFPDNKRVLFFSKHLNFALLIVYAYVLIFNVI